MKTKILPQNFLFKTALLILCLFAIPDTIHAGGFEKAMTKDSIKISYKWRKYKRLRKNSPEVLMLKLENLRNAKVTVSFRVVFHWKGSLHSRSSIKEYCMKPEQTIKGKKWELAFYSQDFAKEDFTNPFFSWFVEDIHVEENQLCTPGLKLKLVPSYPDTPDKSVKPINNK